MKIKNLRMIGSGFVVLIFMTTFILINCSSTSAETPTVFHVDSYGADSSGTTDSTSAIIATIAAAKASNQASVIQFSSGTYLIDREITSPVDYQLDYILNVNGLSDCTIQGEGASETTILINNPAVGGFYVQHCVNFTMKDFTIDYKTVPYTQGTVFESDVDNGTITIDLDEGYADFNDPMFSANVVTSTYGMPVEKNSDKGLSRFGPSAIHASSFTHISDNRWQINVEPDAKQSIATASVTKGTRYVQEAHRWVYALYARFNKTIELRDVNIYASPSLTTSWNHNEGIIIHGLNVDIKPETTRLLSTNADGIQAFGNRDGFLIEDCSFYGMSDDAISLSGKGGYLWEPISDTQVRVNTADSFYRAGDVVQILDTINKTVRATVNVESVTVNNIYIQTITFDEPVPGMVAVANVNEADVICNLSACDQDSIIQNNLFYSHRGRHIVMRSHDCIIQGNDFSVSYSIFGGVHLEFSQQYASGPAPYNIDIKNNTFTGFGAARDNTALMMYSGTTRTGGNSRTIKNITIENNTFDNMLAKSMWISGCETVLLKNNVINVNTSRIIGPSIYIAGSAGITIDGLIGTDANKSSRTTAVIQATNTVKAGFNGNLFGNIDYTLTATGLDRPQIISDASNTFKLLNSNSEDSSLSSDDSSETVSNSSVLSDESTIDASSQDGSAEASTDISTDSSGISSADSATESLAGDNDETKGNFTILWIVLGIIVVGGAGVIISRFVPGTFKRKNMKV